MASNAAQTTAGTVGYAPLPAPVLALVKARIATLMTGGQRIR